MTTTSAPAPAPPPPRGHAPAQAPAGAAQLIGQAALARVRIVLVEPSHPGNVGAVARAMRVMGLTGLRLVKPRLANMLTHRDARALAAGADEVLDAGQVFDTLPQALADCSLCVAVSAAERAFGPPALTPESAAVELLAEPTQSALVFGTERNGLSIEEVGMCQRLCSIPTSDEHSSLNLAQAVQVLGYVLRRSAVNEVPAAAGVSYANHADTEGFLAHLERSLVAIRYLDPENPKKLMPRFRRLFGRTRLEAEEIHMLRGICKLMEETAARADWSDRK